MAHRKKKDSPIKEESINEKPNGINVIFIRQPKMAELSLLEIVPCDWSPETLERKVRVADAQDCFFSILENDDLVNKVMEDLRLTPLSYYKNIVKIHQEGLLDKTEEEYKLLMRNFEASLYEWAKTWNLTAPWCIEKAKIAVYKYYDLGLNNKSFEEPHLNHSQGEQALTKEDGLILRDYLSNSPTTLPHNSISIKVPWNKTLSIRERKQMARKVFNYWLEAITNQEVAAQEQTQIDISHLQWLALYQTQKKSYAKLGKQFNVQKESIRDGIKNASKLIHLPCREKLSSGRPHKS